MIYRERLPQIYAADGFWTLLWKNSWESMAIFLLPMAAILATSLITQIEFKNNGWKQVHALPIGLATIFFSKLAVVLLMLAQFLVVFNAAIYVSGVVPYLLVSGVPFPKNPIPFQHFLREDLLYFVDILPIVAAQYLISLRFKNFLVPVGAGFVAWVLALGVLRWKFGYLVPYTYCMFNFLKTEPGVEGCHSTSQLSLGRRRLLRLVHRPRLRVVRDEERERIVASVLRPLRPPAAERGGDAGIGRRAMDGRPGVLVTV